MNVRCAVFPILLLGCGGHGSSPNAPATPTSAGSNANATPSAPTATSRLAGPAPGPAGAVSTDDRAAAQRASFEALVAARNQDYAQCALKAAEAVARAGEPRARTLLASCEASAGMKEQAIADYERARTDAEAARVAPAADTASRRLAELRGEPPPVAAAASGPSITLSLPPYRPSPPATPPTISPRPIPTLSMPPARAPGADGKSRPFDRYAAQQALSAVRIDGCATPAVRDAIAHLSLTFLTDGSIGAVVIQQPASLNNTDVGKCVSQKMATVRVPAFDGSPVQVGKSYAFTGAPVDSHIPIPY